MNNAILSTTKLLQSENVYVKHTLGNYDSNEYLWTFINFTLIKED